MSLYNFQRLQRYDFLAYRQKFIGKKRNMIYYYFL